MKDDAFTEDQIKEFDRLGLMKFRSSHQLMEQAVYGPIATVLRKELTAAQEELDAATAEIQSIKERVSGLGWVGESDSVERALLDVLLVRLDAARARESRAAKTLNQIRSLMGKRTIPAGNADELKTFLKRIMSDNRLFAEFYLILSAMKNEKRVAKE